LKIFRLCLAMRVPHPSITPFGDGLEPPPRIGVLWNSPTGLVQVSVSPDETPVGTAGVMFLDVYRDAELMID
jgi:hypothetical protein